MRKKTMVLDMRKEGYMKASFSERFLISFQLSKDGSAWIPY
jgi:hypothetical protein